jgi:predicted phosphodiesterase
LSWQEKALEIRKNGGTWPMIYATTAPEAPSKVRSYIRRMEGIRTPSDRPVGVFGDTHMPFVHPNYLQFLKDTFAYYDVGEIVCTGDLVDHHVISRHQTEPCAKSAYDELDMAKEQVAEYIKAFRKVKMCRGNHDERPVRQAATVGMGERYLKNIHELFNLPETWEIKNAFVIDGVLYKHGVNCAGKDGAINAAISERMSTVIGHTHAFAGCKYTANHRDIIFGLNVGCGIDIDAYAFEYGRFEAHRPILGCGIVFNKDYAIFVPMPGKYFRH